MHEHLHFLKRRKLLLGGCGALASGALPLAAARASNAYPTRPITFICPWPGGGSSDLSMRNLVLIASRELNQRIVVENRAGGGGMVGTRALLHAEPDGYTIGQIPISITRFAQLGTTDIDPLKDISYICRTTGQTFGIAVRADSRFRTLAELQAYAKAKPGELAYSHSGLATAAHVGMELFLAQAGVKMADVPQKGGAHALLALQNGKVDVLADSTSWVPQVLSGKLRLLATWNEQRLLRFPDVPTLTELGYKVSMNAPNGIGAPQGVDPAILLRLRDAFRKAVLSDRYRKECDAMDITVMYQDADEYREYVAQTYVEEARLIERLKLRALLKTRAAD